MTLTLKTAKHAIDEHGGAFRIVRIVENFDDLTERPNSVVTRAEAEDIGEYDPGFKPCVVVTTAREALDAAWELAHEPEDGVIPADTRFIRRGRSDGEYSLYQFGPAVYADGTFAERRLLDPPEPEPDPEPEPWEESRFCYASGNFYKRMSNEYTTYWRRSGSDTIYRREALAELNPRPVTIQGDEE